MRTFKLRKHAEAFESQTSVDMRLGLHIAQSQSPTVAQAAADWLVACEQRGLERWTLAQYDAHVRVHILPLLGSVKLARLTVPAIPNFETQLRAGYGAPGEPAKPRSRCALAPDGHSRPSLILIVAAVSS